jgi:hypothetical protein
LHLHLPPGYHAHLDPEFLVLGRTDGSVVARFSCRELLAEEVEPVCNDRLARSSTLGEAPQGL